MILVYMGNCLRAGDTNLDTTSLEGRDGEGCSCDVGLDAFEPADVLSTASWVKRVVR